jgi:hypothetical protein
LQLEDLLLLDLNNETLLAFVDAPKEIERMGGKRVNVSTIHRWAFSGVRRVRLEAVRLGNVWYTTKQALQRFVERLTCVSLPEPPEFRPPSEVRRASAHAEVALEARGA